MAPSSQRSSSPDGASAPAPPPPLAPALAPHHHTTAPSPPQVLSPSSATRPASLAQISVPSFAAFRSHASSIPARATPLVGASHSPRAASFSATETPERRLADEPASATARPLSLDTAPAAARAPHDADDSSSHPFLPLGHAHHPHESIDTRLARPPVVSSLADLPSQRAAAGATHAPADSDEGAFFHASKQSVSSIDFLEYSEESSVSGDAARHSVHQPPPPPSMTVEFDGVPGVQRTLSDESLRSDSSQKPKSPGGKLSSFFGWKSSAPAPGTESSPTTPFSERSLSPLPSPSPGAPRRLEPAMDGSARLTPPTLDIHKANAHRSVYFDNPDTPILFGSPETNAHVRELEKELAQVSSELAGSIRREMELEDELDRIRLEIPTIPPAEMTRRTSDYFSDSGASSTRYPVSNPDARLEQLEQKLRKAEQDKAQFKVEMAALVQDELARRRDLEQMVHQLEERLGAGPRPEDVPGDTARRLTELETALDETKRRLAQERQAKDSFGDLFSATRLELEQHKNENDNLRDEVLPQLRSRIEGLEAEVADKSALTYENTRMQQELSSLQEKMQVHTRFGSIAEEGSGVGGPRSGLSRSNSLARNRSVRGGSLTRSGSVKGEGRQRSGSLTGHPEGVKEIEDQRDALHKALKLLISRYEKQQRDHARAIKKLGAAQDQADVGTPKNAAYHREVSFLKDEVTILRKRTEDALDQKWQYEKGLSGLKMDLDRAEQETRGLRSLLQEHDILTPGRRTSVGADGDDEQSDDPLKISVAHVERERDQARQMAEDYRQRAQTSPGGRSSELLTSAQRMDELADQLEEQVRLNTQLRDRLAHAVAKGERDQKESTRQIEEMQKRLAGMEDSVLAAQQHSETTLGNHEAEVRRIEEATSPSLQRLRISIPEPKKLSPSSPLAAKSPKLGKKLADTSLLEASRTQMLERKVRELEGLLKEAEDDVQVVVQRVNHSQLEVAELQTERDAAFTQMRKLQDLIVAEREKADALIGS